MIPDGLNAAHISLAAKRIDTEGIPPTRGSLRFDVVIGVVRYPPKLVISYAHEAKEGTELPAGSFHGTAAMRFFVDRGYQVIDKKDELADESLKSSFAEGAVMYKLHRAYERDTKLAKRVKLKRLAETGRLVCDVCDFDFQKKYGSVGRGYIEAHHKIPVSELAALTETVESDLALLCSNCHRVIHRSSPMLSISELRSLIRAEHGDN